jgi:hypothetical protein
MLSSASMVGDRFVHPLLSHSGEVSRMTGTSRAPGIGG